MQLVSASVDQQLLLMNQFASAAMVQQWGGETFSYPLHRSRFLQQLQLPDTAGFALLQPGGQMIGFGQLCDRFDKIHLARLLIFKNFRGKGHAKQLIRALLTKGIKQWPERDASLYVYRDNHPAVRCYQQLGFVVSRQPAAYRADLHFMTLPAPQIRSLLSQPQPEETP